MVAEVKEEVSEDILDEIMEERMVQVILFNEDMFMMM